MDVEDFANSEVAIAVAASAAVLSPRVRRVLRRSVVYGVAGALLAWDAAAPLARGTQQATSSTGSAVQGFASKVGSVVEDAARRTRCLTWLRALSGRLVSPRWEHLAYN